MTADQLSSLFRQVQSDVPQPSIDWRPFFEDVRLLNRYAAGEDHPADAVLSAIGRIEATAGRVEDEPIHDLERSALSLGRGVARQAWVKRKGATQGWGEEVTGFIRELEAEHDRGPFSEG
jgi:hypothetical protein